MKRAYLIPLLLILAGEACAGGHFHIGKPFFQNVTASEYHGHNRNFDIECDCTGMVYVANFEGLLIWDGVEWKMLHTPGIYRTTSLCRADDGRIWVGGYNTLGYVEKGDSVTYLATALDSLHTFGEVRDLRYRDGLLTFDGDDGSYMVRNGQIMRTAPDSPPKGSVRPDVDVNCSADIMDLELKAYGTVADGVLFTDTAGCELLRVNTGDGLCSDNISSMAYDGRGSLWGTTDNGLFRISVSPVFTHFTGSEGLSGQVNAILSSSGTLLAGTLQGLFTKGRGEPSFRKAEGLNLACWQLVESADGRIYAATAEGLFLYGRTGLSRLTSHHTLSVLPLHDGTILLGEIDGMYLLTPEGHRKKMNDIPGVSRFTMDEDGGITASNTNRQFYHASDSILIFGEADGSERSMFLHYEDPYGQLWHPGPYNDGLVCESLSETASGWLKMLDEYTVDAMYITDSVAFAGGSFGIVRMDLRQMDIREPYTPSVRFRSVDMDGSSVSCTFSADKTDPCGETRYSYRLHEDGEWSPCPEVGRLSFEHLRHGKYALSVMCIDAFGHAAMTPPLPFEILPPFYLRWYATLFYIMMFVILAVMVSDIRTRRLKKEELRLQQKVDERTAQLKEAQGQLVRREREAAVGKLTNGLIDRILNPMNYINNFSHISLGLIGDLTQDIEDEKESMSPDSYDDATDILGMLKTNLGKIEQHGVATTRILKAMEELLKDRPGRNELTDMVQICTRDAGMFTEYYKDEISECGIIFNWLRPQEPVYASADMTNISKTIMSLLSNAVYAVVRKYRKSPHTTPEVTLSLEKRGDGQGCVIKVHDNGVGIGESIMDRIFDPFFTTKPTAEASGVGLYFCQKAVHDMGGTITVRSIKDEFTEVTVTLPQ